MSSRIEDLEVHTRLRCQRFLELASAAGHRLRVTHTLRTFDEQAHLYAKGRTLASDVPCHHSDGVRPVGTCQQHPLGAQVTKARPGESPHNHGMAFDFCFEGREPFPLVKDPRWLELGKIGESLGLSWGGPLGEGDRFTFDRPHFERLHWKKMVGRLA